MTSLVYGDLLTRNDMVFPIYFNQDFNEGNVQQLTGSLYERGSRTKTVGARKDVSITKPDAPSVQRRKILLAGMAPSVHSLISTFVFSMGWACTVIQNNQEMPAALEREAFDALVIDLGRSHADAEQTILRIKQMRPSLGDRLLVIGSAPEPEIVELVERYDLIQLSQEGLLPQLWATLQELLVSPRSRELPSRGMPVARMIFDSLRYPMPPGIRGSSPGPRQFAYQHKKTIIDLSIEFAERSGLTSLTGQVLDGERKNKIDGLPVLLVSGMGTLARTTTNQSGEFQMECRIPEDASLEIRLGERCWVLVPLGKMEWTTKRKSSWRTET